MLPAIRRWFRDESLGITIPVGVVLGLTLEMVLAQLKSALVSHGLKEINPVGMPFDANLHESISAQPSADVPEGHVLTVVRPGFILNGRVPPAEGPSVRGASPGVGVPPRRDEPR